MLLEIVVRLNIYKINSNNLATSTLFGLSYYILVACFIVSVSLLTSAATNTALPSMTNIGKTLDISYIHILWL